MSDKQWLHCAQCGHRVRKDDLVAFAFCSEKCVDDWENETQKVF